MDRATGRIVVVSATVGAGHDTASRELAARLSRRGFRVDRYDFMRLLPGRAGARSLRTHHLLLQRAPWVYGSLFGIGNRGLTPVLTRLLLYPARRRIMSVLTPDVRAVVSTYPLASQVLSALRTSGRLPRPVLTYATDFAVHRHWVAPGVDAHLTPHPVGAAQARALGGRGVRVAGALVASGFRPADPAAKARARQAFGLPEGRLALVVAGSWGVGEVEATVADIAATGIAEPIVACGHNEALRRRLWEAGVPHALGWTDDMPTLMRAVDVLVENGGGQMALEGMASGVPVMSYRPLPGHGRLSAAALAEAGVSTWVRRPTQLGPMLLELSDGPRGRGQSAAAQLMFHLDAADPIAEFAGAGAVARAPTRAESSTSRPDRRGILVAMSAAAALGIITYLSRRPAARA